jgi:hypothetical protein
VAEDRALPNLKARLMIDTSDAQRAQAAVTQARTGIQGMIADAKAAGAESAKAAAAQRAEAAAFQAQLRSSSGGGVGQVGDEAAGATTKIRGLGAAATSMGGAFGGAAGEATRFASVLAYGGVAGAAAIGLAKLVEFGAGLNDTEKSLRDLQDLSKASSPQELVGSTITAITFGDINKKLEELGEAGPAGVGTLLNLRDAYAAAGRDTSVFDQALEDAHDALLNQQGATERGKAQLDAWGIGADDAAAAADRLAEAARRLETTTTNQASAATSLLTTQSSVVAAHNRVLQAQERLANFGTQATGKSIREQRDQAAAVESAAQRIVDAQQQIIDARQKVADAQEKLAHAGEHERLDVQDAQDAVDAALRKVNASTPEERGPAQHALDDARQKLVDAKRALDSAKPDAERALADAVRGVDSAMRTEADAHRQLADAQDRQAESSAKATKSQGDYQAAVDDVNAALLAEAQLMANQKALQAELASGIKDGPVIQLGYLKQSLRELADDLDPNSELAARIAYLLAALTQSGAQQLIQIATPGHFKQSARGNHLMAGEPSWVGDRFGMDRAELFVPDVPGTVLPINPMQLAGMSGHGGPTEITNHYNEVTVVTAKEPAERAIRRELERRVMLARR